MVAGGGGVEGADLLIEEITQAGVGVIDHERDVTHRAA
jgi:hypothetical protein